MEADGTHRQTHIRRARVVCHRCHEKKIRCDLQRIDATCSNCFLADTSCEFRPSHKGHHRRKRVRDGQQTQEHANVSILTESSASPLPPVDPNGLKYLRALLGHQSRHYGNRIVDADRILSLPQANDEFMPGIVRTYLEVYSEACYTWCPIVDIDGSTVTAGCVLLDHSLASIASRIRPPMMPGFDLSTEHYERARYLFYTERQHDPLTQVKAALLLSCCDNNKLRTSMEGSFWWLGVAIRIAQDIRLHRAPHGVANAYNVGLQKRIWWTLFARERTMALCQGRPCTIDEDDCNLGLPSVADFPEDRCREAHILMHWVNICRIMGQVNKHMTSARRTGARIPTQVIASSLIEWLQSLPDDLALPIRGTNSIPFARDIHFLHLPYLTTIAITYLNSTNQDVPEISVAAVMAAACITRIVRDVLLRGCADALPEDSSWYITIAIIALMHVRPVLSLRSHAIADIHVLRTALKIMSDRWSSAKILAAGLDKIKEDHTVPTAAQESIERMGLESGESSAATFVAKAQSLQDLGANDGVSWTDFFTFATVQTSPLVEVLLTECRDSHLESWPTFDFNINLDMSWDEFQTDPTNSFYVS